MNIDLSLFNLINQFAGRWAWLDYFGIFCADYLGYVLLLALALILVFNYKKYWRMVFEGLITAFITRFVLAEIIRRVWFRARPFVAENFIPLISQSPTEASFPSGHATFYFALATMVYFHNLPAGRQVKNPGIWFFIASTLIAVSRVFVGVHWPSDVLVGAILGISMGWLLNMFFRKYANKIIKNYNQQ